MLVRKHLKRVRVTTLLDLLLDELELTYLDRDGLILITTPEDAESKLQIRVYDCRDLLAMANPGAAKPSPLALPHPGPQCSSLQLIDPERAISAQRSTMWTSRAVAWPVNSVRQSAAWAGGLRDGDLIMYVNGKRIVDLSNVNQILAKSSIGVPLEVIYEHNGEKLRTFHHSEHATSRRCP